jgi:TonB family protein
LEAIFLKADDALLVLWFAILLLFFILPMAKRYRKVTQFNGRDEILNVKASWMAAPIRVTYPGEVKKKRVEGSVIVEIEFNDAGDYVSAKLLESSGSHALDESVLIAVEQASLLPNKDLTQQWKVTFKLEVPSVMPTL